MNQRGVHAALIHFFSACQGYNMRQLTNFLQKTRTITIRSGQNIHFRANYRQVVCRGANDLTFLIKSTQSQTFGPICRNLLINLSICWVIAVLQQMGRKRDISCPNRPKSCRNRHTCGSFYTQGDKSAHGPLRVFASPLNATGTC